MKTSTFLKRVKKNLFDGHNYGAYTHLCVAIEFTVGASESRRFALMQTISEALGRHSTYVDWAIENVPFAQFLNFSDRRAFQRECQRARHAWLDDLIRRYAEQGD